MAGTSILGGGGGAGGGGLKGELPGGMNCAKALPACSARMTAQQYILDRIMPNHVVAAQEDRKRFLFYNAGNPLS